MPDNDYTALLSLEPTQPIWERVFTVAPLVVVGTMDLDGAADLAPKHMAFPLGWDNYFGFVCAPSHGTYQNIVRDGSFTVTYPRPADIVRASLTATPRCDGVKPIVDAIETFPARQARGVFIKGGHLFLECELERVVDGLGANALVVGKITAAHVHPDALRSDDRDDADLLLKSPVLAYLDPGRFAVIDKTQAFPFPEGMRR